MSELLTKVPLDPIAKFPTLEQDNADPSNQGQVIAIINNLDWKGMSDYYKQLIANPGDWSVGRNCSDIVAETLQARGMMLDNNQPIILQFQAPQKL